MVLNNLECTGSEFSLLDCPSGLVTTCRSNEIAGVECHPRTGRNLSMVIIIIIIMDWRFYFQIVMMEMFD